MDSGLIMLLEMMKNTIRNAFLLARVKAEEEFQKFKAIRRTGYYKNPSKVLQGHVIKPQKTRLENMRTQRISSSRKQTAFAIRLSKYIGKTILMKHKRILYVLCAEHPSPLYNLHIPLVCILNPCSPAPLPIRTNYPTISM